jgi:hypothetical protein
MGEAGEIRYRYRIALGDRDVGTVIDSSPGLDQPTTSAVGPDACYDEVVLLVGRLDRLLAASQALRRSLLRPASTGAKTCEADDEIWSILGL